MFQKTQYTFLDLKHEICEMLSIPKKEYAKFHILEGAYVYSPSLLVYPTHLKYYSKHLYGDQEYVQMKDKLEILNGKIEEKVKDKVNVIDIDNDKSKFTYVNKEEMFFTLLEEYIKIYRTIEGVYLFLKHDKELEKMTEEHKKKIEEVNEKKNKRLIENKEKDKEEENGNVEWRALEQIGRIN